MRTFKIYSLNNFQIYSVDFLFERFTLIWTQALICLLKIRSDSPYRLLQEDGWLGVILVPFTSCVTWTGPFPSWVFLALLRNSDGGEGVAELTSSPEMLQSLSALTCIILPSSGQVETLLVFFLPVNTSVLTFSLTL